MTQHFAQFASKFTISIFLRANMLSSSHPRRGHSRWKSRVTNQWRQYGAKIGQSDWKKVKEVNADNSQTIDIEASVGQAFLGHLNEAPRLSTYMHINVGSEAEPTKLQIQTESERADLIVTAPLAIHNTICHKRTEPECTQCQAHVHRQGRLKRYATCLAIGASLALCAAMAATVLPATSKHDEQSQTQDHF